MDERIEKVINSLKLNNINSVYCETKEDVVKYVENLLPKEALITSGGSMSLIESGVWDLINKPCYNFLNRNRAGITLEEQMEIYKQVIGIDYYFCSANAVTENGELLNVDGFANRISAIAFGPKKIIMVVGANKIVKDLDEAFGLMETVEKAAQLYMLATASGSIINTITDENLWATVERFQLEDMCRKDFLDL